MKDPNDFMLAQSEGEQVKRLTAELAAAHRAHLAELNGQETRIRSLEAGIELYKVELAVANEGWLAADKLKLDAQNQLSVELALRQTAEAYAARNALRVIAVEAELAELKKHVPLKGGVPLRQYVLEAALRDLLDDLGEVVGQRHHRDKYRVYQISPQTVDAARKTLLFPPQTETPEAMHVRIVTETADAIAKERGLPQAETKGDAGG